MTAILSRHHDVMAALHAPQQFSNRVSKHLNVPNGMDGDEHRRYRSLIEPFFTAPQLAAFQPRLRFLVEQLITTINPNQPIEIMDTIAHPFAVHAQCAFMGWPAAMTRKLTQWMQAQNQATRVHDRRRLNELAQEFTDLVVEQLAIAREQHYGQPTVTRQLTLLRIDQQPLPDEYLVSMIRNWTVGELGTIAAAVGSIIAFLATHPLIQAQLRQQPQQLDAAIQEILRLDAPLLGNRRRTTCPVHIANQQLPAESTVHLDWQAANTDIEAFEQPYTFDLTRDQSLNLLYGAGPHVCPGKPLAQLELGEITRVILEQFSHFQLVEKTPIRAQSPRGGYQSVWVQFNH